LFYYCEKGFMYFWHVCALYVICASSLALFEIKAMVVRHVDTTPQQGDLVKHSASTLPKLMVFRSKPNSHGVKQESLGWTKVLFGPALFPGGQGAGGDLFKLTQEARRAQTSSLSLSSSSGLGLLPHCVGRLHWGSPLRVMSSNQVTVEERRSSLSALRRLVQKSCASSSSFSSSSSSSSSSSDWNHSSDFDNNSSSSSSSRSSSSSSESETLLADSRRRLTSSHTSPPAPPASLEQEAGEANASRQSHPQLQQQLEQQSAPQPIRAVFVVRKQSRTDARWYTASGLGNLTQAFNRSGVTLEPCCNFKRESPCAQAKPFLNADVVVGLHGAGLANAALANEGAVVVELKDAFKRQSSLFKKVAQGRRGAYVWANTQPGESEGRGQTMSPDLAEATAQCAVALWHQGQEETRRRRHKAMNQKAAAASSASSSALSAPLGGGGLPCACLPNGGGETPPFVKPGIYGIAPVGHDQECTRVEAGLDCHAGLITKPSHPSFKACPPPHEAHLLPLSSQPQEDEERGAVDTLATGSSSSESKGRRKRKKAGYAAGSRSGVGKSRAIGK
jgi:hypothetical protein